MSELTYKSHPAASGAPTTMVIFVHGYGANGADLIGLAQALAPHMPDTVFHSPDAPERSAMNPMGFQWFPIPWLDGSSEAAAGAAMERSAKALNDFIDARLAEEGMAPEQLILLGFSQGTMLSLHVAPRRAEPVAGVVGFSGRLLAPERLADEVQSHFPIILIHGDADDVVPFESMAEAGEHLGAAGFEVYGHVQEGTAHGIAPDGLGAALGFMRQVLAAD